MKVKFVRMYIAYLLPVVQMLFKYFSLMYNTIDYKLTELELK